MWLEDMAQKRRQKKKRPKTKTNQNKNKNNKKQIGNINSLNTYNHNFPSP